MQDNCVKNKSVVRPPANSKPYSLHMQFCILITLHHNVIQKGFAATAVVHIHQLGQYTILYVLLTPHRNVLL